MTYGAGSRSSRPEKHTDPDPKHWWVRFIVEDEAYLALRLDKTRGYQL
jgi:hypothetical protein